MINQAIAELNELSELLNEVSLMIENLDRPEPPVDIVVKDVDIIFDVAPVTEYDVALPRNAKVISMFQNLFSPKRFTGIGYCTSANTLTASINIEP